MIAIAVSLYYYGTIANLSIDYGHTPDVRVFPYKGADFEIRTEEWGSTSFDIFGEDDDDIAIVKEGNTWHCTGVSPGSTVYIQEAF